VLVLISNIHSGNTEAKVSIKPDQHVFRGDTVTLRCDIDGEGVTGWRYSWYKDGSNSVFSELQEHTFSPVTESDAGKYFCYGAERGGSRTSNIGDEVTLTVDTPQAVLSVSPQKWLTEGDPVTLICEVYGSSTGWTFSWYTLTASSDIPTPTLSVEPQSSLFTGDSVTLRCEVDQSWDGWEFLWSKNSNTASTEAAIKTIDSVKVSDGGEYRCRARREGHYTDYSEPVTVTIYERPKAKVSIKPDQHVLRGETVTLRCDIDGEGVTGWRYSWYKDGSNSVFSELQEHTFSPVTESDAGKYFCYGAERGGSRTSNIGDEVTLTVGVSPPVSLIISPSRTQHFTSVSLSLSCEDQSNSDRWRVKRYTESLGLEDCSSSVWASQTGSTCTISSTITSDTGVYWCQSESGENYHPVNITVHPDVILESPVHPVTEGDTLTLRCLYQHSTPPNLRADFYKDGSLIQSQTTEMIIFNVSKSHEGFYYCKHSERGESPKSWISVRVSRSESQISVLHTLSSVLAVCPYLLVTVVLIFKCCRMRGKCRSDLLHYMHYIQLSTKLVIIIINTV
uniref:Ig-like domain-containing protein n=1 Tax=Sinocyclocheilus anshuiensis TaxID=1608454 RepID=A0A671L9H2_9TELE